MASFGDIYRVNTNLQTQDASLSLNRINRDISTNSLALSTGSRINRAEDDAAGFTIAIKLRSRTEGLLTAQRNIADAISVLDIIESGFGSITGNLTEMKSLATRAATESLGTDERHLVGKQITGIGDVVNKTAEQTVYQEIELLKGFQGGNTGALELIFQVGERSIDTLTSYIRSVNVGMLFNGTGKNNADGDHQLGAAADRITVTALSLLTGTNPGKLEISSEADANDFRVFISSVDEALENMISRTKDVANARISLSAREQVVARAVAANEQARSRIMDTDFAKAYGERVQLEILQATASAAMAQANVNPVAVLDLMNQQSLSAVGTTGGSGVSTGEGSQSGWPPDLQAPPREPIPVSGVDIDWPPDLAYRPEPDDWPPSL
jgi:flagellin